ncbi:MULTISPECIES: GNAT family N-acetyltransferase [unclassified Streptomyces]|uniref:GNAT family N-acetyltransferase n=1 Tax=unclassified Streptomyces TaxID=2593676 RepID=UPI000DAD831D|nr:MULTISPECIES: GNAT family N-acetyltransferase [unclassified Streptomyces]PZT74701.1 GNAT family N-acetyltransferase [Streptomyces sp. AC1-42T]PZT82316.1 GNAT family N-acetyltransferase [Streptomyces sp. AC1-42W]
MSASAIPAPPVVRRAVAGDGPALGELDRATWSTLHAVQPRPQPPYAPFFDERHPPREILVAEMPGAAGEPEPAGYIRFVPPTPLPCNTHVRQIQGLAVAHRARGRGVGRALIRAACVAARGEGANRMTLRVLGHNAPARALYESEGFTVEGVLPGEFFLNGRYVDDVMMGRPLAP